MKDDLPPGPDDGAPDAKTLKGRFPAREKSLDAANDEALLIKLRLLQEEHADLDAAISALEAQPHHDRLAVARLKKKKLLLKDQIQAVKDQLTPDIIA
ncbi:YdcH family protein [Amphiplicatus metriothermophilus]|uniref:DUF465 domain-containing protein n=1 Tax=Amphiplicatus metriothermophilus TaxID=1519374 RepID=A0A239PPR5_9PROT|nr:DUF465 domain-containing protein [Amphiplicatus metriothermophilus]MBB5518576.1 hypothetical protein [Amphiplicatus metriothermophilus]SNT72265.1 hypothetical protein SAMN06297382_1303 [Amphiplicatus metriothermophilus]